jgi:predicted dienelactone hydrolase
MRKFLLSVLLAALVLVPTLAQDEGSTRTGLRPDAPPYAIRGPHPVGTMDMVIDEGGERPLLVTVWYPALNAEGIEGDAVYDMGIGDLIGEEFSQLPSNVLASGVPDMAAAPYPLLLMSHGLGGSRLSFYLMAEHLASHGFVVMSAEHVGTALRDAFQGLADVGSENTILSIYYRPLDIMSVITFADTLTADDDSLLAGMIDTERIGLYGHSTGGTTALQAGGAGLDFAALETWCADKEDDHFAMESCQFLGHEAEIAGLFGADPGTTTVAPMWDNRIDALVAAAPGGELQVFGDYGVAMIEIPIMFLQGTADPYVLPAYNSDWAFGLVQSDVKSLAHFENGGHLIFMYCPEAFKDGCGYDPVWDMDRAHDLTNHFVTVFMLDALKGDVEAHAALLPDAVNFPGVTYETTMR